MQIGLVGLDHQKADISIREQFSFTQNGVRDALAELDARAEISGCVLLSTCNRTELYYSFDSAAPPPDAARLLCAAAGAPGRESGEYLYQYTGSDATLHLMRVAGGLESRILGEDQILAQVKDALQMAHDLKTTDPMLETLFRYAITAGKRIKSSVAFAREGSSVAQQAVLEAERLLGPLDQKTALVIGNGATGRLVAFQLEARGCKVYATIRRYKHGRPDVPDGCIPIDYEDRYSVLPQCDLAASATTSPHYTVAQEQAATLPSLPGLFLDLAVPRDIDPEVGKLDGVTLLNVDDFQKGGDFSNEAALALARQIIGEEAGKFALWRQNRLGMQQTGEGRPDFPIFINLHGRRVLMAGGGTVAARRVGTLLRFGADLVVVAPTACEEIEKLHSAGRLRWQKRPFEDSDLDGAALAVAATSKREVNQRIGTLAKERGVLVSVADKREECSFYFPAVIQSETMTAGLISNRGNHKLVRRSAIKLRERLRELDEDDTHRQ